MFDYISSIMRLKTFDLRFLSNQRLTLQFSCEEVLDIVFQLKQAAKTGLIHAHGAILETSQWTYISCLMFLQ